MEDYAARYGLDFNPFIKNAHDIIIETTDYRELALRLDYLLKNRGFITPVIIIDEASYINNAVLNDLKMLFNFEMYSRDRAVILLVGLPQLNNTLRLTANEPLKQRITMNFNIDSLTKDESVAYIKSKILGAKGTMDIFNANALEAIANTSNGVPRIINKRCNASMIIAATKKSDHPYSLIFFLHNIIFVTESSATALLHQYLP